MRRIALCIGASVLLALAGPAAAQFRCAASNGVPYESASPCRGATASSADRTSSARPSSTAPRYYGPSEPESRYSASRSSSIGEAPPHLKYMSARCSGLHDALRTASARGLNYDTTSKMRKDYYAECGEDERDAQVRLSQDHSEKWKEKREAQIGQALERDRSALRQEQCGESRRILLAKRARTDLTEGERAELARFESNFRSRCG